MCVFALARLYLNFDNLNICEKRLTSDPTLGDRSRLKFAVFLFSGFAVEKIFEFSYYFKQ